MEKSVRLRIVLIAVGLFLMVAAGLKFQWPSTGFTRPLTYLETGPVQFALIEVELALGIWFLSGIRKELAWSAASLLFAVFTTVSVIHGLAGNESCGCFGRVQASPWVAFCLDVACLGALAWARPPFNLVKASVQDAGKAVVSPIFSIAAAVLICVAAGVHLGWTDEWMAKLKGERLSVETAYLVAEPESGLHRGTLKITSRTERSALLYGGTVNCSCNAIGDLPVTLPPYASAMLTVSVRSPKKDGVFTKSAHFLTDDPQTPVVLVRLVGRNGSFPTREAIPPDACENSLVEQP